MVEGYYMEKYSDMHELIKRDRKARNYFLSLPDYVQEQIAERAGNVNTFESLKDYAQNLLRND